MALHDRIKEIIDGSPYKPAEIARRLGVSRASVSLWMSGGTKKVDADNLMALSDLLGVSLRWLQTGKGERYNVKENNVAYHSKIEYFVPLISWVRAGEFCEVHDPFEPGDAEDWVPRPPGASKNSYSLKVQGDSMTSPYPGARSYPEGLYIIVDPDKEVLPGCRGVFRLSDSSHVTFKELVSDAGNLYLKPLNPQYDKIPVDQNMVTCGKVIGIYMPE